jgi:hypothetical protein
MLVQLFAAGSSQLTVYNSSVAHKSGTHFAGGISAVGDASVDIAHSRIRGNRRQPAAEAEQPVNTSMPTSAACTGGGLSVLGRDAQNVVLGNVQAYSTLLYVGTH